ncbi:MAG: peptidase M3 [Micavibrio sp.]|nr:peptidase M3 [Micavibrio sp.]|tara:strand:- start:2343 stop:4400 length:2058 start_codon:yes stop_codon:yes gene_type:complete
MSIDALLEISSLPNHAPAFDKITDDDYLPAIETAIKDARKNIETIRDQESPPSFENTIVALETSSEKLDQAMSIFYNQLSAVGGDKLHEIAEKVGPVSAEFSNDIMLDEKLFARVKAVYDAKDELDLTEEQKTLLDNSYKGFVRSGALLDEEKKKRFREISQESSILGPQFMNNAKKSMEAFELIIKDEKDLSGIPEGAIEAAKMAAEEKGHTGHYLFTLDFPSYLPVIQYADNRDIREKIWRAMATRAWSDDGSDPYDNAENCKKIARLRHERANLLGFKTHAHYVLERRMAETPDTVLKFLDKLKTAYKPAAEKDLADLKAFAKDEHGLDDLKPWDATYYSEKLKQKLFNFSSEDLRPYFPLDNVLNGCFEHFTKLFNLTFTPNKDYPLWHDDVKAFDVHDKTNGTFIGTLYGDFHPRSGKKDGAWKTSYRDQGLLGGKIERPVIAIVCNFTKPTKDRPSLLSHGEVTTLFHEMGHAIHALLSDVTYQSLAGTNVLWDFVELPSQVQENWCYEKETLDLFARHYKTGETIPADLIEKIVKAKNFMVGMGGLRQVSLGMLDMQWHAFDPARVDDVAAFEDEVLQDFKLFDRLGGPTSTAFNHIFAGGYSAGYYSYKWAEVLDADTFELFLKTGLYNRETAESYKNHVLSKGGSLPPNVLYQNFRGRNADPDSLLRREGLIKSGT